MATSARTAVSRDGTILEEVPMSQAASPTPADQGVTQGTAPAFDLSKAQMIYINFCRVTSTAEEVILDFALQSDPSGGQSVVTPQRITLSHLTAKRLLSVLQATVDGFEKNFGKVEDDIVKRLSKSTA
jgi:hypothetical protein